jgi:transcriptional regulator with XRE-family HTH domain
MNSQSLIELVLKTLSCSQKEFALQLGVSQTQITKWKKGEHMSYDMEKKIRAIINIGDEDPDFILWAGSIEEADKWKKLIHFLAETAEDSAETGYVTYPLSDELGLLCWQTLEVLMQIGVGLPHEVPTELDFDYESADEDQFLLLVEGNPYSKLIYDLFLALNDVWGFYNAYIMELVFDDNLGLENTGAENIEPCLIDLAACKLENNDNFMPKLVEFRHRTVKNYEEWINIVKDKAFRAGVPLRAELMELVTRDHEDLGQKAETESLGLNSARLHPDIYMNEILCSLRTIHQVLPAILEKLGIDFKLDDSEFYIK